jgi:hypothetical protein
LDAVRGRTTNQQAGRLLYSERTVTYPAVCKLPEIIEAFEKAKKTSSKAEIVGLINDFDLPREAIPTQWLNELEVWDALLQRMPLTALVRNLGKMSAVVVGMTSNGFHPRRPERPRHARRCGLRHDRAGCDRGLCP